MIRGFGELAVLILSGMFGFLRGAFDTVSDYIVFGFVYVLSTGVFWFLLIALIPELVNKSVIVVGFIILLPALLPASIAHRYWLLWKLNKQFQK